MKYKIVLQPNAPKFSVMRAEDHSDVWVIYTTFNTREVAEWFVDDRQQTFVDEVPNELNNNEPI